MVDYSFNNKAHRMSRTLVSAETRNEEFVFLIIINYNIIQIKN